MLASRAQGCCCSCPGSRAASVRAAAPSPPAALCHPHGPSPGRAVHPAAHLGHRQRRLGSLQQSRRRPQASAPSDAAPVSSSSSSSRQDAGACSMDAGLLRRLVSTSTAAEALELLLDAQPEQQQQQGQAQPALSAADANLLLERSLEAANAPLALSLYSQLCAAKRAQVQGGSSIPSTAWPAATLQHTDTLIRGLCRQLRVAEALTTLRSIRSQGVHASDAEVSFGHVVSSPLPPQQPLAVVQPQEGSRVVADSNTRYEFELFSGTVTSCSSEALAASSNPLVAAARLVGLWRRPPVAAVHELVVRSPSGASRTFRVGTGTADVPAALGERVTLVCAPNRGANKLQRLVLSTSPPGTRPGEAMLISNHATGGELPLLRPPVPGAQAGGGAPGWLLPAAVLLAGGDAASGLVDPALPLLITGALTSVAVSAVASNTLLVPSLKKLPVKAVKLESIRQQLLAQHASLESKVKATMQEASDDVRTLARLWQLTAKMQTVDGASATGGSAYEARKERVAAVAGGIETRLAKRLELLDGYARVMAMIEIEVEMDMQIPVAELDGIGVELGKLSELESIREEWQFQAEAQDEVEKLLRSPEPAS